MIPIELELENFLAYQSPGPLQFEGIHIACLAGANGAGKSSLLDAITWVLWGRARSNSPDDLVHQGKTQMRVTLVFEQGGMRYRVTRQRQAGGRGASLLELHGWEAASESWRGLSDATLRSTQARIENLLRLDYETFINSAFLMQGKADEFTTKTPGQRKQVLATILGLSRWEVFETRAKEKIAENQAAIQRLDGWLQEVETELGREAQYQQKLSEVEAQASATSSALAAAESQWTALEQTRSEMITAQRQLDDLRRRIHAAQREIDEALKQQGSLQLQADREAVGAAMQRLEADLAEFGVLQEEQERLSLERSALAEEIASLNAVNQALKPQTEPVKARLATLSAATEPSCPICGQALSDDHRHQLVAELEQEIEDRRADYRVNQEKINAGQPQLSALDARLRSLTLRLKERLPLEKKIAELQAALAVADQAAEQLRALAGRIERWQTDLASDQARDAEMEKIAREAQERLQAAAITQGDLDRLRLDKRMADEAVGGARQQLHALQAFAEQRSARLAQRQALATEGAIYDDLRIAFGKRGVPAMIIETAVPELERSANELLGRMTDNRLRVRIETQREIKTGETREALDIIISDELGSRAYELYSGGEAFRINFAIRIALSRLLARRAGAQLRSLFIDEGFGTQDAVGREQLVSAINSIQDDFDRILVITHIEELKSSFPTRIEVTKTPDGSVFSLS